MSFRKSFSEKRSRFHLKTSASHVTKKPSSFFDLLFSRNASKVRHKHDWSRGDMSDARSDGGFQPRNGFLGDLELELIYTRSVLRQRLDSHNRDNIRLQLTECARLIDKRLTDAPSFIDSLSLDSDLTSQMLRAIEELKVATKVFGDWTQSLTVDDNVINQATGQDHFSHLEYSLRRFISLVRDGESDSFVRRKRNSIDNGSIQIRDADLSIKSRFSEEDRMFIEKLKKMEQNIDRAPPKPQFLGMNETSLNEYLSRIEDIVKAEKELVYGYSEIVNSESGGRNVMKVENNCIMATSMTSDDIPTVDGVAIELRNEVIPKQIPSSRNTNSVNGFHFESGTNKDAISVANCRSSMPERDKNLPLPPVPVTCKLPMRSPMLQSPSTSTGHYIENSLQSPTTSSQIIDDDVTSHCSETSRFLLMAKQMPSVVDDPNQFLNISDMKDDIDIVSRSLNCGYENDKRQESKRFSNCSSKTIQSLPANQAEHISNSTPLITTTTNDGTIYNSEVKSDTEEYFEYFEIDGKKYRRKMKKRTVIEKIRIQKTIYAPLKPDGSGPDFAKFKEDDLLMIDDNMCVPKSNEPHNAQEQLSDHDQSNTQRSDEDKFRVSRLMFSRSRDDSNCVTANDTCDSKNQLTNKSPALVSNYMYRIGQSEFEEPIMNKQLSTQLMDDVNSTWMKTSEFDLPHEKSKSICYFKNLRQKNEDGNTIHSALRITASRTVRMKAQDTVSDSGSELHLSNNVPAITIYEEDIGNQEESLATINDTTISSRCQSNSFLLSTDEEKEVDSPSSLDSLSVDLDETISNASALDDSDLRDSFFDEPSEVAADISTRCSSPESCINHSEHNSFPKCKDRYSFILTENNPTPYLIFDEDAQPGECEIAGGPVDALIVYACDGEENLLYLGAFLDTYRTFIEPEDLINRLIIRYKFYRSMSSVLGTDPIEVVPEVVKMRGNTPVAKCYVDDHEKKCIHILSLLLTIIGKLKKDLTESISCAIELFADYLQRIQEDQWVHAISNTIKTQRESMENDNELAQLIKMRLLVKDRSKSLSDKVTILEYSSHHIAEQMTLLDWAKYRDVELIEVLNLKDIANCKLPGVIGYAKHFRNVQHWTQSILLDPDRKTTSDRDQHCLKFLRIMKHLRNLNNFSSLIAILLGIQLLPAKKLFSKRIRSKITEMENYMKPTKFIGYKEDLRQAVAPCIPFLGIFYQDIVMLNIANPPYLDLDEITCVAGLSGGNTNSSLKLPALKDQCGPIINFWRSFKQYLFLKNCNKDQDKIRYSIRPDEEILQFMGNFHDRFDECTIQRLAKQG